MTVFSTEGGFEESFGGILGKHLADNPRSDHQNVHIVVLYALMGGVVIVTKTCSDALELICRDGNADPAAAHQNASVCLAGPDVFGNKSGVIRIIVWLSGFERTYVADGMP